MSKKEIQAFVIALALSLLIHLAILFGSSLSFNSKKIKVEQTTMKVSMQDFSLNENQQPENKIEDNLNEPVQNQEVKAETLPHNNVPSLDVSEVKQETKPKPKPKPKLPEKKVEENNFEEIASYELVQATSNIDVKEQDEVVENKKTQVKESVYAQNLSLNEEASPVLVEVPKQSYYTVIVPQTGVRPSFPKQAELTYEGPYGITGKMNFNRDEQNYHIDMVLNIPFNKRQFISEGTIENNRLIPLHYYDKRKDKLYASAEFDYKNGIVRFGKGEQPNKEAPFNPKTEMFFDLFSWAWQMSIDGGNFRTETLKITNGKKIYEQSISEEEVEVENVSEYNEQVEKFYEIGNQRLRIVEEAIEYERQDKNQEQNQNNDENSDSVSYAFAPDFANIPAVIKITDKGKKYEIHVIGIKLDNVEHWRADRSIRR